MRIKKRTIWFLILLLSFSWVIFYASHDVDDLAYHYFYSKTSNVDKSKIKEIFKNSIVPRITTTDINKIPPHLLPDEERIPLFRYTYNLYIASRNNNIFLNNIIKISAGLFKFTTYNKYKQSITYPEYVGSVTFFSTAISFIVTLLILFMVLQTQIGQRGVYIFTLTFIVTILGSSVWIFSRYLDLDSYLYIPPLSYFWGLMFGSPHQNFELYIWAPRGQVFIIVTLIYLLLLSYKRNFLIIILLALLMFLIHFAHAFIAIAFLIFSEIINGIFIYFSHLFLRRKITNKFVKISYFSIPFVFNILTVSALTLFLYYAINFDIKEISFLDILISIIKNTWLYAGLIFSYIFFTILYTDNNASNKFSGLFEVDQQHQWMKGFKLTAFIQYFIIYLVIFSDVFIYYSGGSYSSKNISFPFYYSAPQLGWRVFDTFGFILRMQIITLIFFSMLRKRNMFVDEFKRFYKRIITSKKMFWIICAMCILIIFVGYIRLEHVNYNIAKGLDEGGRILEPKSERIKTILFMASKFPNKWFADEYNAIFYDDNYNRRFKEMVPYDELP